MTLHVIHFMRSINPDTFSAFQNVTLSALKEGAQFVLQDASEGEAVAGGGAQEGDTGEGFFVYISDG